MKHNRNRIESECKNLRILYAEDDPDINRVFTEYFHYLFGEVVSVCDGRSALKHVECDRFDLLVIDLDMPIMTGVELLDRIEGRVEGQAIMVVSGNLEEFDPNSYIGLKIKTLRKPITRHELTKVLVDLLSIR